MINIKSKDELQILREGGHILHLIFTELEKTVVEGTTSIEINKYAEFLCKKYNVKPAFKGYHGFPYAICANPNDVIVHGFSTSKKLKNGDIFGLDMGIIYKGFNLDKSSTIIIGKTSPQVYDFVNKTKTSMYHGIEAAIPGNKIGDISAAMREGLVGLDFRLMRDFVGHGIGRELHESPNIPGEGLQKGEGEEIRPGMAFAIESISVNSNDNSYYTLPDEWTVVSKNHSLSALFEETVIVTDSGVEIVTVR